MAITSSEQPTPRQLEILARCARGESREEIGVALILSPWTVKADLDELRDIIGARNVTHALAICVSCGLLEARPGRVIAVAADGRSVELAVQLVAA